MSATTPSLLIQFRGLGHIPGFKNSKMILWSQRRMMTKPEYQRMMDRITAAFESALRSELATRGTATTTGPIPPSQIALCAPLDDSRKWIPEHSVSTLLVSRGEEGADVVIEKL